MNFTGSVQRLKYGSAAVWLAVRWVIFPLVVGGLTCADLSGALFALAFLLKLREVIFALGLL